MKVAAPVENGTVSIAFARAPAFAIYDVTPAGVRHVETITNPYANEARGVGPLVVQMLTAAGVEAVAAANIGPNAFEAMQAAGIRFYQVPPGTPAEEAVKTALSGGTINTPPQPAAPIWRRRRRGPIGAMRKPYPGGMMWGHFAGTRRRRYIRRRMGW